METVSELLRKKSHPVYGGLTDSEIEEYLSMFPKWKLQDKKIQRTFEFKNFYETMSFVNAVAYIANTEDHHPEMVVSYNKCTVKYDTHDVNQGHGGISQNDFICVAKVEVLFDSASN